MDRILKKLKPIFLLVGLSLAALLIVNLTNLFIKTPEVKFDTTALAQQSAEEQSNSVMLINGNDDTSEPEIVPFSEVGEEGVLSVSMSGDCAAKYQINSISVCKQEKPVVPPDEDEEEIMISPNATFYLKTITVPLELFSGMNVIDSNRLIEKDDPVFKSGGEQIDEATVNNLLPPNVQIDTYKPYLEDVQFGMEYVLRFSGGGEKLTDEGKAVVDKKNPNDCEDCNNASNPTPQKTNNMADFMQDSLYRYPGQKEEMKENPPAIERCDSNDRFEQWTCIPYTICRMGLGQELLAWLNSMKDILKPKTEKASSLILVMSSAFGAVEDCPDGFCTNSYMDIRYSTTLAPSQDDRKKVYYLTECVALVQGIDVKIPCAWDFTHLFAEKDVAAVDNIPEVEEEMTDDEYNDFLLGRSFCRDGGDWVPLQ